jgi:hypothetical protein
MALVLDSYIEGAIPSEEGEVQFDGAVDQGRGRLQKNPFSLVGLAAE